jgi:UDPglucose--hexose-1-phosphate uridylyltransferase
MEPSSTATLEFPKVVRGQVEYRKDPLTGQQTRINPARARRPKQGEGLDSQFEQVIASSQGGCPFCPERILDKVPRFAPEVGKDDGRIFQGDAIFFPNLSPFGDSHAVGVICKEHFLDLDQFTHKMVKDSLVGTQTYIRALRPEFKFPVFVWNYMPPSAGSIIHPHVQVLVEETPVPELERFLTKASEYYAKTNRNYYADLYEAEKGGARWIGENDSVFVLATFAPRGFNEVQFVFKSVASVTDLTEKQIDDFVSALLKVFKGYKSAQSVGSFNIASYSAPARAHYGPEEVKGTSTSYWLVLKLFSRPSPKGVYTNDTGPMERMYDSFVIDSVPEQLAESLKPFFSE